MSSKYEGISKRLTTKRLMYLAAVSCLEGRVQLHSLLGA
jgi:hypothetical protein